ncbi:MAG: PAS domain S-box protein [Bacteroidetes bacterium]|nr:PAS domain S-box protein [Bacteroidota bacterium]
MARSAAHTTIDLILQFFDLAPDAICIVDATGQVAAANRAFVETVGRTATGARGTAFLEFVAPEDRGTMATVIDAVRGGQHDQTVTVDIVPEVGPRVRLEFRSSFRDGRVCLVGRNVSDRRPLELELNESEDRFRRIVERSPEAAVVVSNGQLSIVNDAAIRLFGASGRRELEGTGVDAVLAEGRESALWRSIVTMRDGGGSSPLLAERILRRDGTAVDVEAVAVPVRWKGVETVHVLLRDVTEHRKAEKALRASENKFRSFVENVFDGVYQSTPDGRLLMANSAMVRMLGYDSEEDLLRVNIARDLYVQPSDRERLLQGLPNTGQKQNQELRLKRKDGREIICLENTRSVRRSSGEVLYYEGTLKDITEWKRVQEALRSSEERYREFFDDDLAGHFISRPDGTMLACNAAFARVLGYDSVEEILGVNARRYYPSVTARDSFVQQLRSKGRLEAVELDLRRKDGKLVRVIENVRATFDAAGELEQIQGVLYDITERKNLEAQLRESQKMETLGTLASGIAHDFNNLLAIIGGYAAMLRKESTQDLERYLEPVETAVARGAGIVRQLMTFARENERAVAPVDINRTVREVVQLAEVMLPENVRVEFDLQSDLPAVEGDVTQFHQALLNLVKNARDAMPNGGGIVVRTRVVRGEAVREAYPLAEADRYVQICVADEGEGISDDNRLRIFEPFFTTKGVGKGSGLGLAVVYGVVHSHHGFVDVMSHEPRGTEFHLFLPATTHSWMAAPEQPPSTPSRGTETILVIEDEPMLLDLLEILLSTNGYRVLTAADGDEALRIYRERHRDIAVVLSDMGLPKVGGWEVFQRMRELNPRVRSILASGYLDVHLRSDLLAAGAKDFIQKPYIPDEILKRIREVIDEPEHDES